MANEEHVAILKQSVDAWNAWRKENPDIRPDLRGAILSGANLREADLSGANLREADLSGANLVGAIVVSANLSEANLSGADHHGANLSGASFYMANLSGADLRGANLYGTTLVDTNLAGADFTGCYIYGVSAWHLTLERAKQQNLVITPEDEPTVTVDNIEVAQFIYLLLHNQKVREVIDTITSKAVLILGRFTDERKAVLDALREELRKHNYLPILFDFEVPAGGQHHRDRHTAGPHGPLHYCRPD